MYIHTHTYIWAERYTSKNYDSPCLCGVKTNKAGTARVRDSGKEKSFNLSVTLYYFNGKNHAVMSTLRCN